jgi:hypothetical protein
MRRKFDENCRRFGGIVFDEFKLGENCRMMSPENFKGRMAPEEFINP